MPSILNSYVKNDFQVVAGDAWKETWPIDKWDEALQQFVPLPLAEVSSIVCTARNEETNTLIRGLNQNVFNANNGTYVTGYFSFFFQVADTTLEGDPELVDQETHQFSFTITLTNGTKTTLAATLYVFAKPAVDMAVPGNVGRVISVLRSFINESDPMVVTDELLTTYIQRGLFHCNEIANYYMRDFTPAQQLIGPLVANEQNVALPGSVNEILFVYLGTNPLDQKDWQYLQNRQLPVAQPQPGTPQNYIQWKRSLAFDPSPDAAAVAATPYPWVRAYTAPPPFRLYGADLIPDQFLDVPCLWAAAEWYTGPYGGQKTATAKGYVELFNERIGPFKAYYDGRYSRKPG